MADETDKQAEESGATIDPSTATEFEGFSNSPVEKPKKQDERMGLPDTVVVETVNAPTQLQAGDPTAQGPWIQYNGIATVRVITKEDWEAAQIDSDKYVEWNYLNHKRVPVAAFSDEELQYLLRCDGRFTLVEE